MFQSRAHALGSGQSQERTIEENKQFINKEILASSSTIETGQMATDVNIRGLGVSASHTGVEHLSAEGTGLSNMSNQQSFSSETDASAAHKHPYGSQRYTISLPQHLEALSTQNPLLETLSQPRNHSPTQIRPPSCRRVLFLSASL